MKTHISDKKKFDLFMLLAWFFLFSDQSRTLTFFPMDNFLPFFYVFKKRVKQKLEEHKKNLDLIQ